MATDGNSPSNGSRAAGTPKAEVQSYPGSLLDQVSQGDREALLRLWETHQDRLKKICHRYMRQNQSDAEDALSCVLERVLQVLPRTAAGIRNLRAWLNRIAVNECLDLHRAKKRRARQVLADEEPGSLTGIGSWVEENDPLQAILHQELADSIRHAVDSLPAQLREASVLYFMEELLQEQIAKDLKISPVSVRKRIQRARALLQSWLSQYLPLVRHQPPPSKPPPSNPAP